MLLNIDIHSHKKGENRNGRIRFLTCHVTLPNHLMKDSCRFMGDKPLL